MEFDNINVRIQVVEEEEDRLSSLPDDLIHKILSSFDTKFVVQTCLLLSRRWKLLWTSLPCLDFDSWQFGTLQKFAKFVKHVLAHRNHQIQVSSVKLYFYGALNQDFVKNIAKYAFSHNVQELTVLCSFSSSHVYPLCLFSSQSLKHFTLTCNGMQRWKNTTKTPLDFPALTTLDLSYIVLCGDLFSKCVNLKKLTIQRFYVVGLEEAFDIIAPRLSRLILTDGCCSEVLNLIAPQLENLTIIDCEIKYLNAPSGLSSFCYTLQFLWSDGAVQFTNDRFHSLNKVSISLSMFKPNKVYKKEDARKAIGMLQELHSARYLTLNADTVECISSFPELLSQNPSPFSNLISLTIDSSMREDAYETTMSREAKTFFLESSPNATLIMKSPNQGSI